MAGNVIVNPLLHTSTTPLTVPVNIHAIDGNVKMHWRQEAILLCTADSRFLAPNCTFQSIK